MNTHFTIEKQTILITYELLEGNAEGTYVSSSVCYRSISNLTKVHCYVPNEPEIEGLKDVKNAGARKHTIRIPNERRGNVANTKSTIV